MTDKMLNIFLFAVRFKFFRRVLFVVAVYQRFLVLVLRVIRFDRWCHNHPEMFRISTSQALTVYHDLG